MDVSIILFLNKIDLLQVIISRSHILQLMGICSQAKLKAGVRLKDHLMQYGDRPNDFESVSRCESLLLLPRQYIHIFSDFQNKFSVIHQEFSVSKSRELKSEVTLSPVHLLSDSTSVHFTSVTDTRRTATIMQRGEYGGPTTRCADNEMCAVREIIITANLKSVQLM